MHVREKRQYGYNADISRQLTFCISNAPTDVVVDDTGDVYVSCSDSNCIKVFDRKDLYCAPLPMTMAISVSLMA